MKQANDPRKHDVVFTNSVSLFLSFSHSFIHSLDNIEGI